MVETVKKLVIFPPNFSSSVIIKVGVEVSYVYGYFLNEIEKFECRMCKKKYIYKNNIKRNTSSLNLHNDPQILSGIFIKKNCTIKFRD